MEQRPTAIPVWISELLSASFQNTEDSPSTITLPDGRTAQRVRIYGVIVSTEDLVVDDGTGSMLIRSFEKAITAQIGDPVIVIGRPRLYNDQQYLLGEITKKIDPRWLELRKKQKPVERTNPLEIVRTLDTGEGADYDEVIKKIGTNGENIILRMLTNGELFETKPGKLKPLE